jgi:hypothetical protein
VEQNRRNFKAKHKEQVKKCKAIPVTGREGP